MTLFFRIDTITNQVRHRTRATWWRSRPAHNLQRSNGAGPPCHPRTPPKAAQPKAQSPQPVAKSISAPLPYYAYSTRQGQERGFSPPRDVRFLDASHEVERRAHWAPAGEIFGPLFRQTDGAGPLFRQTDGVTHVLDSGSTS